MNLKELFKGIIAVLIVGAAVVSFFWTPSELGAEILRPLAGIVVGFYFGVKEIPFSGVYKKK